MEYVYSKYLINKKIKNKEIFYNLLLRNYIEIDLNTSEKLKKINNNFDNINFFVDEGILVKKDCWKAFHNKVYEELLSLYFKYKEQVKI